MPAELIKHLPTYGPVGVAILVLLYAVVKLFLLLIESYKAQIRFYKSLSEENIKVLAEATRVIDSNSKTVAQAVEILDEANDLLAATGIKARREKITRGSDDKKR